MLSNDDSDFCLVEAPATAAPQPTNTGKKAVDYRNPKSSHVFSTALPNGETVAWVKQYETSNTAMKKVFEAAKAGTGFCNTCAKRASKLTRMCGPHGPMLFHQECGGKAHPGCYQHKLHGFATAICRPVNEYELVLVTDETFPPAEYTGPGGQQGPGPFYHMTIVPDLVTSPDMVPRMTALWQNVKYTVRDRLAKFLSPEARSSMQIILDVVKGSYHGVEPLERSSYWQPTCEWIVQIQTKFAKDFACMTRNEQDEVCIFAMATGNAQGPVHYNFQTANNLVDFMVMESAEQIRNEMDKRSDPRFNQVSQLARAKAAKGVINNYGVGLIWDGKVHRDDLDLHVMTPWGKVWYSQTQLVRGGKVMAKLDFDAGISGGEAEPAENISLDDSIAGQKVEVYVDNFTRRTQGDVHCSIVITQQGNEEIVLPVVWPKGRSKGNLLHVCSHTFTEVVKPDVALSETRARAALAQDAEFAKLFGVPTSVVATVDDLVETGVEVRPLLGSCPVLAARPVNGGVASNVSMALSEFDSLVAAAKAPPKKKTFISDRTHSKPPRTVDDLWQRLASGPVSNLSIHLPDHVPGYVTKVTVASDEALHGEGKSALAACHFQDKSMHPIQPVKTGNARLDTSWIQSPSVSGLVPVAAVAKVAGKYMLVLEGARLPSTCADFPLAAGFYPQDLSAVGHKHRSKWSFLNTSVQPQMPAHDPSATPVIGAFLTNDTATVFVDGTRLVLGNTTA